MSGMSIEQIQSFAKQNHLVNVTYKYVINEEVEAGKFISINVNKSDVRRDEGIIISISLGKNSIIDTRVEVADFTHMTKEQIETWGINNRINIIFSYGYSTTVVKDKVTSQSIVKGTRIEQGSVITIGMSLGKQTVITNFSNRPYSEFTSWRTVQDVQIETIRVNEYHNTIAKDNIISNTPNSGVLYSGNAVRVVVSLGKPAVSNYTGRPQI